MIGNYQQQHQQLRKAHDLMHAITQCPGIFYIGTKLVKARNYISAYTIQSLVLSSSSQASNPFANSGEGQKLRSSNSPPG